VIDFTSDIICQNKSLIFIEGGSEVTLKVQVKKQSINSGCIFVLGNNVKFAIKDVPAGDLASGDKTKPDVDLVEAGIIASGATVTVEKGSYGTISRRADRLVVRGFLYSSTIAPMFSRYLAPVDNKKYPSEYFIYDATLLDSFRALLGFEKTVDVVCGTSTHIFCGKK
jgi:hypothetical protein